MGHQILQLRHHLFLEQAALAHYMLRLAYGFTAILSKDNLKFKIVELNLQKLHYILSHREVVQLIRTVQQMTRILMDEVIIQLMEAILLTLDKAQIFHRRTASEEEKPIHK